MSETRDIMIFVALAAVLIIGVVWAGESGVLCVRSDCDGALVRLDRWGAWSSPSGGDEPADPLAAYPYGGAPEAPRDPYFDNWSMTDTELAEAHIDFVRDEHLLGDPITVVSTAYVYAEDAAALGLPADNVTYGEEPDVAAVFEGQDVNGEARYVMLVLDRKWGVHQTRTATELGYLVDLLPQ